MNQEPEREPMYDYKESIDEFIEKVIPQIFKADLLPGYSRATLTQADKHVRQMKAQKEGENTALAIAAYGVMLGETMVRTIEGAEWMYEAPNIQMVRVKLPVEEGQEAVYALPITRAFNYFSTKDSSKSILSYYDNIYREFGHNTKKIIET